MKENFRYEQWRMLLALLFCYAFYYTGRQNLGFAIVGMQENLHFTPTQTGIISGGLLLFYGIGQAINGRLGDYVSVRLFVTLGALLTVFFNFLAGFAITFSSFLVCACLIGYVQSFGFAPGCKLITNWWEPERREIAIGLFLAASGVASIITYSLCLIVLEYFSWRWLFRLPVILLLISGVFFYAVVRDKPEQRGFAEIPTQSASTPHSYNTFWELFLQPRFQLACCAVGFCSLARYALLIWVPVIYLYSGNIHDAWFTILLPFGMAMGALVTGLVSSKKNQQRISIALLYLIIATIILLVLYVTASGHNTFTFLLLLISGFFVYGPQTSFFALCPELLGAENTSTGVGIMNAYGYAFSALGEILIGYLIQHTQQVSITFLIVAIACVFSAILAFCILPKSEADKVPQTAE